MKKIICMLLLLFRIALGASAQSTIIDGVLKIDVPTGFAKVDIGATLPDIAKTFNNDGFVPMFVR